MRVPDLRGTFVTLTAWPRAHNLVHRGPYGTSLDRDDQPLRAWRSKLRRARPPGPRPAHRSDQRAGPAHEPISRHRACGRRVGHRVRRRTGFLNEYERPQRDSNPCYSLERAVSWAGLDDGDRGRHLYPEAFGWATLCEPLAFEPRDVEHRSEGVEGSLPIAGDDPCGISRFRPGRP
jgi:hypothetical protein